MTKSTGNEQRLLAAVETTHEVHRTLDEDVFVPAHGPRKATAAYRAMHKDLVKDQDRPCIVCGVRYSTLGNSRQNPYGAATIETHHRTVEWSLMNAIDLAKFNQRIVHYYRRRSHHDPIYDSDFSLQQMKDWIDHHHDNIWVLCDIHHRHKWVGVHSVTGPIWGPQDLLKPGFRYTPLEPGKSTKKTSRRKAASSFKRTQAMKPAPAVKAPRREAAAKNRSASPFKRTRARKAARKSR